MGKTGGFLEHGREEPGYRPRSERVTDYKAVERQLSDEDLRRQAARCMECGTPFCHGCGCPLVNCIPEFNELAYQGRWQEAADILLSTSSFPEFTARLCPAPCEGACVLGINDDPVTIRQIELKIIEKAFEEGYIVPSPPKRRRDARVAVIGSGPAGLSVAQVLNQAGVEVVVFDNARHPGGIMRYGIPDFKMEKWVLDRRIDLMQQEGVVFEMGVMVGVDVSFRYLHSRFDAVCLSGGAREPRDLPIPGRELDGIHFAMEYLVCQNKLNANEPVPADHRITAQDKTVVVIGGGDTGSDCVGTAVRQGAKAVHQLEILPKPPTTRPEHTPWPMYPQVLRESSSHKEGGQRHWSVSTKAFTGKDGHVNGLDCVKVDCERQADGRLQFTEQPDSAFSLEAQLVLLAMGFVGPGRNRLVEELQIKLDKRGNVQVDQRNMTSAEGVFAAGDMARGQSLIVTAMADGRQAAHGILDFLRSDGKLKKAKKFSKDKKRK